MVTFNHSGTTSIRRITCQHGVGGLLTVLIENTGNINSLAQAELTFDDAYWGGSCLSISGQTAFSRMKLFKTMLEVKPDYEFSVTYKTIAGRTRMLSSL